MKEMRYLSVLSARISSSLIDLPIVLGKTTYLSQIRKRRIWIPIIVVLTVTFILVGNQVPWSGFNQRSLWDWMELLIIPIVLGAGIFLFYKAQRMADYKKAINREHAEQELSLDRQRQEALITYLNRMENFLLQDYLRS